MKAPFFLFFSLLFISNITTAQEKFKLKGVVIDQETRQPLPYAHIGIPELGIGTTASDKGEFEFKIPTDQTDKELTVSFIGFKTFRKKVKELGNPTTIKIEPEPTSITEIEVLGENAVESIIRKAVKRIPKNYPSHGHTDLAFYREARTGKDSQYIYLAEGVLNVYKKSYKSKKEGQVSLIEGRKINIRNPLDTTVAGGFSSGHMAAHRFDFVYNREDFLQEKYFPVYQYWIEGMTTYNGNPVYIIAFNKDYDAEAAYEKNKLFDKSGNESGGKIFGLNFGKKKKLRARMKGKVYIDKNSYAIIKGEFEITPEGLKKWNDYPLYSGNWKGYSYIVNYQQIGKKWYFSDAFRRGIYGGGGIYTNEVKITQINPQKTGPLPYLDRMKRNQQFTRMTGSYDPDFWANYNTTPLNAALAASVEQMQNAKKAREALDPVYLAELQLRRDSIEYVKQQQKTERDKENMDLDMSEIQQYNMALKRNQKKKKKKRDYNKFSASFGLGTHLISTPKSQMGITILSDDEPRETIMSLSDEMKGREFEIIGSMDFDIFFRRNFFMRFGSALDFADSRYKERSVGLGLQMNFSKQRPFFFRAMAQYSNLKYYRKLGLGDNDYGKFKIEGKKFKANDIKLNYGSRTHNLKLSAEMAIELNPAREFYIRGTYFMPFHRRQDIWMQERKEVFRKKTNVPVSSGRVQVTQNDVPFDGQIMPDETISITIGWVIK